MESIPLALELSKLQREKQSLRQVNAANPNTNPATIAVVPTLTPIPPTPPSKITDPDP
jgi:hypothetical protein